jgi:hypothetical protein
MARRRIQGAQPAESSVPTPAEARVTIDGGLWGSAAQSLIEFVERHVDPRITVHVEPGSSNALGRCLAVRVNAPGAFGNFKWPLAPHGRGEADTSAPFGSRGWAYKESMELVAFSQALQRGMLGEFLTWVDNTSRVSAGGQLVWDSLERGDPARGGGRRDLDRKALRELSQQFAIAAGYVIR